MKKSYLLDRDSFQKETLPSWFMDSYSQYKKVVTKQDFPCFFGKSAEQKGELRYSFLSHADWSHLPQTLRDFLTLINQKPLVRRGLFVFVEPEEKQLSLDYYRQYFWDVLQYLHEADEKPWPVEVPTDPDHFLWSFCFEGQSLFAFGNAPAYQQRVTRNLGDSLVIGFQPRVIFQGLEGTEPNGINSRKAVRERVEKWDGLPKHPDISHYGDQSHHEWKQFFIGDDCEKITSKCPFHTKNSPQKQEPTI